MQQDPPPFVWAVPDEKNILNWHYIVRGPPDSPYQGGEYHGMILFPPEYPFKPPGIKMLTPSGRFLPDKKICFSMSDFHPGTWNPAWSVATILTGLLSFMLSDEITTGSARSNDQEKRILAERSHSWNIQQKRFRDAFPEYSQPEMKELPNMGIKERGIPPTAPEGHVDSRSSSPDSSTSSVQGGDRPAAGSTNRSARRGHAPARNVNRADGWTSTIGRLVTEKWQIGLLVVVAVLVMRLSA